ncbi:MAG TPA: hypothetical protein PKZ76_04715 [Xanthomonadaceae bacterium]|nr:hypothetical protein [Xanthomonadaceae bacterium]
MLATQRGQSAAGSPKMTIALAPCSRFLLVALSVLAVSCGAAHDDHDDHAGAQADKAVHEHDHHDDLLPGTLSLDPDGRPWATDAPLREGMQRIRDAVAASLSEHDHMGVDATAGVALAQQVDDAVAFLFANCRLEPEADANLHLLLAQMMGASAALRHGDNSGEGLVRLLAALDAYPRHFDHPGWEPLANHP